MSVLLKPIVVILLRYKTERCLSVKSFLRKSNAELNGDLDYVIRDKVTLLSSLFALLHHCILPRILSVTYQIHHLVFMKIVSSIST